VENEEGGKERRQGKGEDEEERRKGGRKGVRSKGWLENAEKRAWRGILSRCCAIQHHSTPIRTIQSDRKDEESVEEIYCRKTTWERREEREREYVCVCVCVSLREIERDREIERKPIPWRDNRKEEEESGWRRINFLQLSMVTNGKVQCSPVLYGTTYGTVRCNTRYSSAQHRATQSKTAQCGSSQTWCALSHSMSASVWQSHAVTLSATLTLTGTDAVGGSGTVVELSC
jgi:hypothetical protein